MPAIDAVFAAIAVLEEKVEELKGNVKSLEYENEDLKNRVQDLEYKGIRRP